MIKSASSSSSAVLEDMDDYDLEDEVASSTGNVEFRFSSESDFNLETSRVQSSDFGGFKALYTAYRQLQYGDLEGWEKYEWMWPSEGI